MDVQLTKDADKLICTTYKEYLLQRKSGEDRGPAKCFSDDDVSALALSSGLSIGDCRDTLRELRRARFVKLDIDGGFILTDDAVIYMENRFPRGLEQLLDWMGRFKTAIPFV